MPLGPGQGGGYGSADPTTQYRRQPIRQMGPPAQQQAARPPDRGPLRAPPPLTPYNNPTARRQQQMAAAQAQAIQLARSQGYQQGQPEYDATLAHQQEITKQKLSGAASRYGQMRMNQLSQVQDQLPPELIAQMQGLPGADPAAAWRSVSGAFTQLAGAQGYQDPRLYIQWLLSQRRQQPQAPPWAGVPGTGIPGNPGESLGPSVNY